MRIGILGGGQLGRMLALAGYPLGFRPVFFDPGPGESVAGLGTHHRAAYESEPDLLAFAAQVDVVTFEFENVPAAAAERVARERPLRPGARALEVSQDRLREKDYLTSLSLPVAAYRAADSLDALRRIEGELPFPWMLKTRRHGYDGKGQTMVRASGDLPEAWAALGAHPIVVERFVPFERELSMVAVRGVTGEIGFYPLVENVHEAGILRRTFAPAPDRTRATARSTEVRSRTSSSGAGQAAAEDYCRRLLEALDYVGVLALELFETPEGLVINEFAPRVHNSGHWTIEGAETSQFENHLRAVAGLPLGSTAARGHSRMENLIGSVGSIEVLRREVPGHLHWYGKEPRPGRKVGHVTVQAWSEEEAERQYHVVQQSIAACAGMKHPG